MDRAWEPPPRSRVKQPSQIDNRCIGFALYLDEGHGNRAGRCVPDTSHPENTVLFGTCAQIQLETNSGVFGQKHMWVGSKGSGADIVSFQQSLTSVPCPSTSDAGLARWFLWRDADMRPGLLRMYLEANSEVPPVEGLAYSLLA